MRDSDVFCDVGKLQAITPILGFQVLGSSPPEIGAGALINCRARKIDERFRARGAQ